MGIKTKVKGSQSMSVVDKSYLYPRYLCWEGAAQRTWQIYGKKELHRNSKRLNSDLKLAVENHVRGRQRLKLTSNMGEVSPERVKNGFVIGSANKDFLYLDMEDKCSVWVYYYESGALQRLEDSFDDWLKNTRGMYDTVDVDLGPNYKENLAYS